MPDFRSLIDIVMESHFLLESRQQCLDMMGALLRLKPPENIGVVPNHESVVNTEIDFAEKYCPRLPQRLWFIKVARLYTAQRLKEIYIRKETTENSNVDTIISQLDELISRYSKEMGAGGVFYGPSQYEGFKRQFIHYAAFPPEIFDRIVYTNRHPRDVFQDMFNAEDRWSKKNAGFQPYSKDDLVILNFPDGMVWVDRVEGSCSVEGKAMGHCGNVGSAQPGDSLLSLRKRVTRANTDYWETFATFIIDENGYLGEMKGRFNEKPSEKYHPYIVALLKEKFVKGILGGGYMPRNNFAIQDLSEEMQKDLFKAKPQLMPLNARLRREGMHQEMADEISMILGKYLGEHKDDEYTYSGWSGDLERFYLLDGIDPPDSIIYSITDTEQNNFYQHLIGEAKYRITPHETLNLLNSLTREQLVKIGFDGVVKAGKFLDLNYLDSNFRTALTMCCDTVIDESYQEEAQSFLMRALKKHPFIKTEFSHKIFSKHLKSNLAIKAWITPERICDILSDPIALSNLAKHGWWGPKEDMSVRWLANAGGYEPVGSCDPDAFMAEWRKSWT